MNHDWPIEHFLTRQLLRFEQGNFHFHNFSSEFFFFAKLLQEIEQEKLSRMKRTFERELSKFIKSTIFRSFQLYQSSNSEENLLTKPQLGVIYR